MKISIAFYQDNTQMCVGQQAQHQSRLFLDELDLLEALARQEAEGQGSEGIYATGEPRPATGFVREYINLGQRRF